MGMLMAHVCNTRLSASRMSVSQTTQLILHGPCQRSRAPSCATMSVTVHVTPLGCDTQSCAPHDSSRLRTFRSQVPSLAAKPGRSGARTRRPRNVVLIQHARSYPGPGDAERKSHQFFEPQRIERQWCRPASEAWRHDDGHDLFVQTETC
jgi:hypothetical protein